MSMVLAGGPTSMSNALGAGPRGRREQQAGCNVRHASENPHAEWRMQAGGLWVRPVCKEGSTMGLGCGWLR